MAADEKAEAKKIEQIMRVEGEAEASTCRASASPASPTIAWTAVFTPHGPGALHCKADPWRGSSTLICRSAIVWLHRNEVSNG